MMTKPENVLCLLLAGFWLAGPMSPAAAEQQKSAPKDRLEENFLTQHEIGRHFQVSPAELPAPKTGSIVTNRSLTVPYSGQTLQVPPGFTAAPFATGLSNPRRLLVLPNGDVLVAEQSAGYLTLLRDEGDGHAKWINRHVEDLNRPYGLAWRDGNVLVADQDGIWRVPHILGALRAGRSEQQTVDQVPPEARKPVPGAYGAEMLTAKGVFGIVQGHQNRHLAVDPKPATCRRRRLIRKLRIEPEPKATIQRFDKDGKSDDLRIGNAESNRARVPADTGDLYAVVQNAIAS